MNRKLNLLGKVLFIIFTVCPGSNMPCLEYLSMQIERTNWINLNGKWTFDFVFSKSGIKRSLFMDEGFEKKYHTFSSCAPLSEVNHKNFMNST